jgi:hypothetical protein
MYACCIPRVLRVETLKGPVEPGACKGRWCAVARSDQVDHVKLILPYYEIGVCMDEI